MSPKEKAKELVDKYLYMNEYYDEPNLSYKHSKQCALIAVQEIINSNPHSNPLNTDVHSTYNYWLKVKLEIEIL